jgi:hypothetical protein
MLWLLIVICQVSATFFIFNYHFASYIMFYPNSFYSATIGDLTSHTDDTFLRVFF